jgi:Uncharacterized protein conserved in bacteria
MKAIKHNLITKFRGLARLRQWLKPNKAWTSLICPTGDKEFILVGSIHMGVPAMSPLPSQLEQALVNCDALVVEADITLPFSSQSLPQEPVIPLTEQLNEEQWQTFDKICQECRLNSHDLVKFPAWQVGLTLQQKQAYLLGLRPEFGIDHQLLTLAHQCNQSIITLETPEQQLALLTELPDQGLPLLIDSLAHWRKNARQLQQMIDWWLTKSHSSDSPLPSLSRGFSHPLASAINCPT